MNIEQIAFQGFMSHADTKLTLPPRGVVLLTGKNGAGKSTIVEAISVGMWGKTLRGTDPWSGARGTVVLTTREGLVVKRPRKGLVFAQRGVPGVTYENLTKAQEALSLVTGSWDAWRRSCVFSSSDASHFTLATDTQRKHLLEEMLGLGRFDGALTEAQAQAKKASAASTRAASQLALIQSAEQAAARRERDARASLAAVPPVLTDQERSRRWELFTTIDRLQKTDLAALQAAEDNARATAASALATERQALAAYHDAVNHAAAECAACRRPFDNASERAAVAETADKACAEAQKATQAARRDLDSAIAAKRLLNGSITKMWDELDILDKRFAAAEASTGARELAEKQARAAHEEVLGFAEEVEELELLATRTAREEAICEAMVRVLGMKGVRAHLLGQATASLEHVANAWLSTLTGTGMTMQLKPYTENKTGGFSDKLSLEVLGAGGGHGYKAASGGERRRIDIAIMLALGQMAAAASGKDQGTLLFDEVFDAIDTEGIERAVGVIADLARTRCCVVISHSAELASRLPVAAHYVVDAGQLVAA